MNKLNSYRKYLEKNESTIMFGLHFLFACALSFSESLISIFSGFYILYLLFALSYKRHFISLKRNKDILFLVAIFMIYLIGAFFSSDLNQSLYELKKTLFWWIFPIGIAATKSISRKQLNIILYSFVISVIISSIFSFYRYLNINQLHITNFRDISLISHINFSLIIGFAIVVVSYFLINKRKVFSVTVKWIMGLSLLWLLAMLIIVNSLLGIVSLGVTVIVLALWFIFQTKKYKLKAILLFIVVISLLTPLAYVSYIIRDFYSIPDIDESVIEKNTINGNRYTHKFDRFEKENGNLVNLYICKKEISAEWNKKSKIPFYGRTLNDESLYSTLIRYMTSKGLRKDSLGFASLNNEDISNIEKGVANYIFVKPSKTLYSRIYETIWEVDIYYHTGRAKNKTLSQRIEQVRLAKETISRNFIFGVGTGDVYKAGLISQEKLHTDLPDDFLGKPHLQYLTYWIKFGLLGLLVIIFSVFYPFFNRKGHKNILFLAILVLLLVANLGDNQWENHVALPFFVFFYSLFAWGHD